MRERKLHRSIRLKHSDKELIELLYGTVQQWVDSSVKRLHIVYKRKKRIEQKQE